MGILVISFYYSSKLNLDIPYLAEILGYRIVNTQMIKYLGLYAKNTQQHVFSLINLKRKCIILESGIFYAYKTVDGGKNDAICMIMLNIKMNFS